MRCIFRVGGRTASFAPYSVMGEIKNNRQNPNNQAISRIIQLRIQKLTEIPAKVHFLMEIQPYEIGLFEYDKNKSSIQGSLEILQAVLALFQNIQEWNEAALLETLKMHIEKTGLKTGTVMWPIRIALSGLKSTPGGATEIAYILGKAETMERIQAAITLIKSNPGA